MTEKDNSFKARAKSEAGDFVKRDLLGASEWRASKLGYLTGLSSLVRGGATVASSCGRGLSAAARTLPALFRRDTAQPLKTASNDPAERFEVARQQYGRSMEEIDLMVVRSARQAWIYLLLLVASFMWGVFQVSSVESGGLLAYFFPFFTLLFLGPLALRACFWNWQLRTRRLGAVSEFLHQPGEWFPSSKVSATVLTFLGVALAATAMMAPSSAIAATGLEFLENGSQEAADVFMRSLSVMIGGIGGIGGADGGGPVPNLPGMASPWTKPLGEAFRAFNSALLALAGAMIGWHTLVGMISTAHEGKVLGQRWHQIWAPVRVTAGVGTLVPMASGYAAIQIIVVQIAVWGSALANEVWDGYIDTFATPAYLAGIDSKTSDADASQALYQLSRDKNASTFMLAMLEKQICLAGVAEGANLLKSRYDPGLGPLSSLSEAKLREVFSATRSENRAIESAGISLADPKGSAGALLSMSELDSGLVVPWVGVEHDGWGSSNDGSWDLAADEFEKFDLVNHKQNYFKSRIVWDYGPICGQLSINMTDLNVVAKFLQEHDGDTDKMKTAVSAMKTTGQSVADRVTNQVMAPLAEVAQRVVQLTLHPDTVGDIDQEMAALHDPQGSALKLVGTAYAQFDRIVTGEQGALHDGLYSLADNSAAEAVVERAKDYGWAGAGSFYMQISRITAAGISLGKLEVEESGGNYSLWRTTEVSSDIANIFFGRPYNLGLAINDFESKALYNAHLANSDKVVLEEFDDKFISNSYWDYVQAPLNHLAREALDGIFITSLQPNPFNALVKMVDLGHFVWGTAMLALSIALGAYIATAIGGGLLDSLASMKVPFVSQGAGAVSGGVKAIGHLVTEMFKIFGFVLLAIALVHAYLIPMMPYIFMFFFVTGMLILIGEALIAAPIWAFMHIRMDGQDFIDQSQRQGYMIAFNLFLRPSLAILGLALSFTVFSASIYFMNETFNVASRVAMPDGKGSALVGLVSMMVIQVYLHYQVALRSFQLITQVPDRVTRWFGAQSEGLNEDGDSSNVVAAMVRNSETRVGATAGMGAAMKKVKPTKDPQGDKDKKDTGGDTGGNEKPGGASQIGGGGESAEGR